MLVGIFTVGLPQSVVRCLTYKDTRSLHRAIIIGTIVIGAMNIGMNFIGVLSQGILTEDLAVYGNSVDNIMPLAIAKSLSPLLAGITIIGPIAASISTISSLLLTATSSIIKDIYIHEKEKETAEDFREKNQYAQSGLYAGAWFADFLYFYQPAGRYLEDQYVCLRRSGNRIFLDISAGHVLEKGK